MSEETRKMTEKVREFLQEDGVSEVVEPFLNWMFESGDGQPFEVISSVGLKTLRTNSAKLAIAVEHSTYGSYFLEEENI